MSIIVAGERWHSGTTEVDKEDRDEADEEEGQTASQRGVLERKGESLGIQVNICFNLL